MGPKASNLKLNLRELNAWQKLLCVFLICLSGLAAFSNSFNTAFQFDDTHTVQSNMYVRSLKNVPQFFVDAKTFSYRPENSGYRPMTSTALALGFAISHVETWGYHLIKFIEHCLVAILIFLIALHLLPRQGYLLQWALIRDPDDAKSGSILGRDLVAFFAALIFVVHRANTETVVYITQIAMVS